MMKNLLDTSLHHIFTEYGFEVKKCKSLPKHEGYTSEIPYLNEKREERVATIWVQKATLKKLCSLLIFEDNPDEATMEDMTKELANLIVGHAKMLAHNQNLEFDIKLPRFTGIRKPNPKLETLMYKIENRCLLIQTEETNG